MSIEEPLLSSQEKLNKDNKVGRNPGQNICQCGTKTHGVRYVHFKEPLASSGEIEQRKQSREKKHTTPGRLELPIFRSEVGRLVH